MTQSTLAPPDDLAIIRNRTFDEIAVGDGDGIERTLTLEEIALFATVSGDLNPQHLDPGFAATTRFHGVIGHGMWGAALISAVLGTRLPGPGTIYLGQTLRFLAPVRPGDTVRAQVQVSARDPERRRLTLQCRCVNQHGICVIEGEAQVIAPAERIERPRPILPQVRLLHPHEGMPDLVARARPLGPLRMAVVLPCDPLSLRAALDAQAAGLVDPVLVGPRARLEAVAGAAGIDLAGRAIADVPEDVAARHAVSLAAAGRVQALMKGSLHTEALMRAVIAREGGLRTSRRISHCFLLRTPAYPRPLLVTDAAINIAPDLEQKADIARNAIALAHLLGNPRPRVAVLAAVETVNPRMPATMDAAALCKMADRGQLGAAVLDGPLAFDNAISAVAARIKGIASPVAGQADVLLVPDLESGNMLVKQLEYLDGAASAGIVLGARVPVVLTSRADPPEARLASCALASLLAGDRGRPGREALAGV